MTTVTRRNVLKGGTALVGGMAGILPAGFCTGHDGTLAALE